MPQPQRFDVLIIDFYGTISSGDREAVAAACERIVEDIGLSWTPEELSIRWGEKFFALVDRSNHQDFRTLHDCEAQSLVETLDMFNGRVRNFDPEPYINLLDDYWRSPDLFSDVVQALSEIRVPICCVSNADAEPLYAAITKHKLKFDAVICSEEVTCYKPTEGIFRAALRTMEVESSRAIHVGDSLHSDISGATRLGITTVWLQRTSRIHDIGECKPDHTITTLAQIPGLLVP